MSISAGEGIAARAAKRTVRHAGRDRERLLALAEGRRGVVTLGRGDPDLPTPPHIIEAAKRALDEGATHYTSWHGRADLREAIAEKCRRDYRVEVSAGQVVVTAGSQEAMYVVFQSLLDPGDEVLLADRHYTSYSRAIRLAGGVPVFIPTREADDFVVDPEDVEALVTPRTKLLVVVSPENPTGAVIPPATIAALARIALHHDLLVVADDIYEKFVYEGPPHASIASEPGLADRTVMINGFSKTYAMTGWRVGYMAVPRGLVDAVEIVKHTLTVCAPAVSQAAALAALTGPQDCVNEMRALYAERRRILLDGFEALGMGGRWSRGALYVYPRVPAAGESSYDFCVRVLERANVLIFPGTAFGAGEGYMRTTLLQPAEVIKEAVARMTAVLLRGEGTAREGRG
ncbi:MAG TPA: pyridoxal phosphate-dependent aminotransferase [bacterium]|nr:pyridoxal phosphate-dependent aminotransferase [bacterium]